MPASVWQIFLSFQTEYKYCYDLVLHYVLHYLNKDTEENANSTSLQPSAIVAWSFEQCVAWNRKKSEKIEKIQFNHAFHLFLFFLKKEEVQNLGCQINSSNLRKRKKVLTWKMKNYQRPLSPKKLLFFLLHLFPIAPTPSQKKSRQILTLGVSARYIY